MGENAAEFVFTKIRLIFENEERRPPIKTITLLQPWASLVIYNVKRIETRSWMTQHRGPLAIHASQSREYLHMIYSPPFNRYFHSPVECPRGVVLGATELLDCKKMTAEFISSLSEEERQLGDYAVGRAAWMLGIANRLKDPVPARGFQSLWDWLPN